MRRTISLFLSSPGDVAVERSTVIQVTDALSYDPLLRDKVTIIPVAWDDIRSRTPMIATKTPQQAINEGLARPSECDVVIVILWSRFGTPLDVTAHGVKPEDNQPYLSGTEWEYLDAFRAAKASENGFPLIVVYRRIEPIMVDITDPQKEEKELQFARVQYFFDSLRNTSTGAYTGGHNEYKSHDDFRHLLEIDLRVLVKLVLDTPETLVAPKRVGSSAPLWKGSPFPGLRAFGPDDAPIFWGRGREVDALISRLSEGRFVGIVGASGSGKSSVMAAGLIPRLRINAIEGSKDWFIIQMKPGEGKDKDGLVDPFASVYEALLETFEELRPKTALLASRQKREFTEELRENRRALAETCTHLLRNAVEWAEIILMIDQFEELFTLVRDSHRAAFVEMIVEALSVQRLRIVVTLRADFYHRCVEWGSLARLLESGTFPLSAPKRDALREMIERPAERAGLLFEKGLPLRILDDTGDEPGNLALMAYTLDELYHACKDAGQLTHEAYENLGGVQGAIGERAEVAFGSLSSESQATLPFVFRELVEVDERGIATRRRAFLDEVIRNDNAATGFLIDTLTQARLLVQSRGENDRPVLEVAHEALLRSWPRLSTWIADTQDDLRLLHQFREAAKEWEDNEFNTAFLWPDERLRAVYAMIERLQVSITQVEENFIWLEFDRLLDEINQPLTTPSRRATIGLRLAELGDHRAGISQIANTDLPDVTWFSIRSDTVSLIIDRHRNPLAKSTDTQVLQHLSISVDAFYISRFPVTNAQFNLFVEAEDGYGRDDWWIDPSRRVARTEDSEKFRASNLPRTNVSWYEANAFANWMNYRLKDAGLLGFALDWEVRLPTEMEWQLAATNGDKLFIYPWGATWNEHYANTSEGGVGQLISVGLYPHTTVHDQTPLDLCGNAWEWCLNLFDDPYVIDPLVVGARTVRGGSWMSDRNDSSATSRLFSDPNIRDLSCGFRLVLAAPIR